MKTARAQQGLTLVELLVALAISAAIMLPLTSLFQNAAASGAAARAGLDLNADASFALERIARRAAALTPSTVDAPMDDANDLLAPQKIAYALSGTDLVETDTSVKPTRTSVIAANVTSFKLSAPATGDGQPLLKIELALAAGGTTVSMARTVRIGAPL